jgi:hypothetical protein
MRKVQAESGSFRTAFYRTTLYKVISESLDILSQEIAHIFGQPCEEFTNYVRQQEEEEDVYNNNS